MMKKALISVVMIFLAVSGMAQKKNQETGLKREVTLYNPYKPSLPDVVKKSFLPDMTDTAGVKPIFNYHVRTYPFMPEYNITPVKPAAMLPDPLPKLYNSFINVGFGSYISPLAEVSISNQRSKKGAIGLYARHFSTNGNVELQNDRRTFAGYMDNDASLYGKKFFKGAILNGSVDFIQRTRYAYGYDTMFTDYDPSKKEIRLNYMQGGANLGLVSSRLDSSSFYYNFNLAYKYFTSGSGYYQNNFGLTGNMAKKWKDFYAGALLDFNYYKPSDSISANSRYIASISPYLKKNTREWNLKLGLTLLFDKDFTDLTQFHIYPDVSFGFNIVPEFISFFADLAGRMENNYNPMNVIGANPYLIPYKTLYDVKNTSYALIVKAGLRGETGIDGRYNLWASYSIVNNMLFFSNYVEIDPVLGELQKGNYFMPKPDDADIMNIHGDMTGKIYNNLYFETAANYYSYSLNANLYAWNKPSWDALFNIKYNLRNKIIAGAGMNALGMRKLEVTKVIHPNEPVSEIIDMPAAFSFNLSAEYRYTKILSFWAKINNISFRKYYEWAYYPTQRFIFMVGFTYSL